MPDPLLDLGDVSAWSDCWLRAITRRQGDVRDTAPHAYAQGQLLDQTAGPVASFTADDAYDWRSVYHEMAKRHPDAAVVMPPRSDAVPSTTAETKPTQRDQHIHLLAERGHMGWQVASGYNWRALVEADVSRFKRVIGDGLRSCTDRRRATEVAIVVRVLSRILDLGRPQYVRTA